jgi:SAM-dependent methyltransferase
MNIVPVLKRFVPLPLRPPLRRCLHLLRGTSRYGNRLQSEIETFTGINVQDSLPPIMQYWSNKYLSPMLSPFGFSDAVQFFRMYMARLCRQWPDQTLSFLSIGAGTCASEINIAEWLRENGIENYIFECVDINPKQLETGSASAAEKKFSRHFSFGTFDVNSWRPERQYHVILAVQSLHHFVDLELLFEKIHQALHPDGFFMSDDMIGRNGHQRWPEALKFVNELWRELPDKYKYNHGLKRFEKEYENWDCSTVGFEGIRSQDILPLLTERFHFDFFVAFGNIVDIFVDRSFGPNFDPENEWDCSFIDRVHALDVREIESGRVKPTHMMTAMTMKPVERTKIHKHLSPEFCVRRPDPLKRSWMKSWF